MYKYTLACIDTEAPDSGYIRIIVTAGSLEKAIALIKRVYHCAEYVALESIEMVD